APQTAHHPATQRSPLRAPWAARVHARSLPDALPIYTPKRRSRRGHEAHSNVRETAGTNVTGSNVRESEPSHVGCYGPSGFFTEGDGKSKRLDSILVTFSDASG